MAERENSELNSKSMLESKDINHHVNLAGHTRVRVRVPPKTTFCLTFDDDDIEIDISIKSVP